MQLNIVKIGSVVLTVLLSDMIISSQGYACTCHCKGDKDCIACDGDEACTQCRKSAENADAAGACIKSSSKQ